MKKVGSIFSGGGLLDEAAKQAGYKSVFGIEINNGYAEIWKANHPGTMHNCCISQVDKRQIPKVDLLIGGIPCEPFSQCRRQQNNMKRKTTCYADHDLADLTVFALILIDHCQPMAVVLEEVSRYAESEIGIICMKALTRMGYTVDSKVIKGTDYGALTTRKRTVIIATKESNRVTWSEPNDNKRTMAEVLHDPTDERCNWFHLDDKQRLKDHWKRQQDKGNRLYSQQITGDSGSIQTIKKRYFAGQGDNPVVKHPTKENVYRWLTIDEVKAIMGLPGDYYLGKTKTVAGEVLGQGVLVDVFKKIIEIQGER